MRQREFLASLVLTTAIPVAQAQQAEKVVRIGYLAASPPAATPDLLGAFRQELRQRGYVEGRNLAIEPRWAEGTPELLSQLASELVRLKVDLIVAWSTPAVTAARQATATLPIVMIGIADPIGSGFVASLAGISLARSTPCLT